MNDFLSFPNLWDTVLSLNKRDRISFNGPDSAETKKAPEQKAIWDTTNYTAVRDAADLNIVWLIHP